MESEQKPISTRLARFRVALMHAKDAAKAERIIIHIMREKREIADFCKKESEEEEEL